MPLFVNNREVLLLKMQILDPEGLEWGLKSCINKPQEVTLLMWCTFGVTELMY